SNNNYLAVKGNSKGKAGELAFVNVYGPHPTSKKGELWNKLEDMINGFKAAWCVFGDFNEVNEQDDCLNTQFQARESDEFNEFIANTHLIEVPLGGWRFTRISDDGMKFSKLDRYLVSDEFKYLWGGLAAVVLDRKLSDHCPIVLKDIDVNFGPKPFKALDIWLEESDIESIVAGAWSINQKRSLGDVERKAWMDVRRKWIKTDKEKAGILKQKSRMKWDIEGDENSKYFHSVVKRRNNKNSIRGLMINGVWSEDPEVIKEQMFTFYKSKFSKKEGDRPSFCNGRVTMLLDVEATSLENTFTEKEIWNAVCGCGSEKAPGPDGFNFRFIKKFWGIIKGDLISAIQWF
ncbi:putative RNA-directed DNA polymerase, partial [Tanacetum coccineum]